MILAPDSHQDPSPAEPGEIVPHAGETGILGARGDRHLEPRAAAGAKRVFGDRLDGVRREPAAALHYTV